MTVGFAGAHPTNPNRIYWAGNVPGRMGFIEVLPQ
jgi:hypothetical protein